MKVFWVRLMTTKNWDELNPITYQCRPIWSFLFVLCQYRRERDEEPLTSSRVLPELYSEVQPTARVPAAREHSPPPRRDAATLTESQALLKGRRQEEDRARWLEEERRPRLARLDYDSELDESHERRRPRLSEEPGFTEKRQRRGNHKSERYCHEEQPSHISLYITFCLLRIAQQNGLVSSEVLLQTSVKAEAKEDWWICCAWTRIIASFCHFTSCVNSERAGQPNTVSSGKNTQMFMEYSHKLFTRRLLTNGMLKLEQPHNAVLKCTFRGNKLPHDKK